MLFDERFDERFDRRFDKGLFDERFNEKWCNDDGLSKRAEDVRMVGGGEAVVKVCFCLAPAPGGVAEDDVIESTSIKSLKGRRLMMSVEVVGMLDNEEMLVLVWG